MEELRDKIKRIYRRYHRKGLAAMDPLRFPARFSDKRGREIAGLISALLAYGRVEPMLRMLETVIYRLGSNPYAFVTERSAEPGVFSDIRYRFNRGADIALLITMLNGVYRRYEDLEACFLEGWQAGAMMEEAMGAFVRNLASEVPRESLEQPGMKFLLPDPCRGSGCKRLNLFFRWMVRSDEIDLGVWRNVSPSRLIIPLDTHILGFFHQAGIVRSRAGSLRNARLITEFLRTLDPEDPVKYDFAIFQYMREKAENGRIS